MTTRLMGEPVRRREDLRLITGRGRYTDDIGHGALAAAFVRSPYAHARITGIDVDAALDVEGVVAIYTYEDLVGPMAEPLPVLIPHPQLTAPRTGYPLARDVVQHVGEAVVMVVATDRYVAEDVCDRITVSYEELPVVVGVDAARAAVHAVHEDVPDNVAARHHQETGDVEAALAASTHTLSFTQYIERSACMPMEGKGVHAVWDARRLLAARAHLHPGLHLGARGDRGQAAAVAGEGRGRGPRRGRRVRREDRAPVARGAAGADGRHRAGPAGALGRGPPRALHLLRPRAGAAPGDHRRLRRRGPGDRAGRPGLARQRRLHALRDHRADRDGHPAGRPVRHPGLPGAHRQRLHQHRHRHALPRRRPAPGLLRHGADDGPDRPGPRAGPGRGPPPQPHRQGPVPLRPPPDVPGRPPGHLRLRRLRGPAGQADRPGRLGPGRGAPGGGRRPRQAAGHRDGHVRRGHRPRPVRGRPRPGARQRQGAGLDRAHVAGPGPRDRVRPDRRRTSSASRSRTSRSPPATPGASATRWAPSPPAPR